MELELYSSVGSDVRGVYMPSDREKVGSLKDFITKYLEDNTRSDVRPYLHADCKYGNNYITMIDIDAEDGYILACLWLKENNIGWSLVKSSSEDGHYWLFLDKTFKDSTKPIKLLKYCPGCCKNYVSTSEQLGYLVVRAIRKNSGDSPPELLETCENNIVNEFVSTLINLYSSDEMIWFERHLSYKFNKIDIENPKYGSIMPVSIMDFLGE